MSYDNWRERLAIAQKYKTVAERRAAVSALRINFSQPGEADCGYYRKPITEKDPSGNGLNIIKGWVPVSYFMHGDKLVGIIGAGDEARDMTDAEVGDEQLWSWVVSHPVTYEAYQGVVEFGDPWPDSIEGELSRAMGADAGSWASLEKALAPPQSGDVARGDNQPPEEPPHVQHATAIDNAIAASSDWKVTTEEEANRAAGAKNRIAELRLAADKAGKAEYQPPFAEYKRLYGVWTPPVSRAEAAEKRLNTKILTFREAERRRIAAEQAAAQQRQRETDEANQRAADRAIAAGQPEQPPVIEEEPPVPQVAPIAPTYGSRKPVEKLHTILDAITDYDAVYTFLKNEPKVKALLLELATAKVRAGFTVPGTTTREGLI